MYSEKQINITSDNGDILLNNFKELKYYWLSGLAKDQQTMVTSFRSYHGIHIPTFWRS